MALPLIPLAAGAALGGAGVGAGSLLGGAGGGGSQKQTKKDRVISRTDTDVDARQFSFSDARQLSYSPQISVDSPGSTQTSKKEMSSTARSRPQQNIPVQQPVTQGTGSQGAESGTNLERIAMFGLIIGGGAYVAGEFIQ